MFQKIMQNIYNNQHGGMMILWAFVLPVIIGFIGFGVEASLWYAKRTDMQSATDAAAVAAAHYLGTSTSLTSVATSEMARNNWGSSQGVSVVVHNPPTSGIYAGNASAIEVIATQTESLLFLKNIAHIGSSNIQTRAVSYSQPGTTGGNACILGTATNTSVDVLSTGNVSLCMPNCVIAANDTSGSAITLKGNSTITVQDLYTAGGILDTGSVTLNNTNQNVTNGSPIPDPFDNLTMPSPGTCLTNPPSTGALTAGTYCTGLTLNANTTSTMSGTYIFNGGTFKVNGQAAVTGTDVTIVLLNGANLDWTGGANINIAATTSGDYAGMLVLQPASNTSTDTINGDAQTNLTGVIYAPGGTLKFSGGANSGGTCSNSTNNGSCLELVANDVTFTGDVNLKTNCTGTGVPLISVPDTPATNIALKE